MYLVRDNASEFRGEIDAGGFHPSLFGNLLGGCSIFSVTHAPMKAAPAPKSGRPPGAPEDFLRQVPSTSKKSSSTAPKPRA
jgi:hypothetical protein